MSNCYKAPNGVTYYNPPSTMECGTWELSNQSKDAGFMDQQMQELLNIAGATINVHKLLGIHEQTRLVDLTGNGDAISGGYQATFPPSNAFTTLQTEWRSKQAGADAIVASAYIGYDFGVIKISSGRQRYGINADITQHITAIKIKQSADPLARVTKARVERSQDGTNWYGVAIIDLPNNDQLNSVFFKQSVPSRYWRLRPITFVGDECASWGVQALEMFDYSATYYSNIQDVILMENRDRDYAPVATKLKGYYELIDISSDLTKFGIDINLGTEYRIRINFNHAVATLGRPVIIGDMLELPSETQYTPDLRPVKRFLEVTDVTWDAATYTPGWQPTTMLITAKPAYASQETQDIFGDLSKKVDTSGLFDNDDGNNQKYQDMSSVAQTIAAEAVKPVSGMPERGSEGSNTVRKFETAELEAATAAGLPNLNKIGFNPHGLYVEDAIPENGSPYTEGPTYPTSPKNGDYHRLTYVGLAKDVPARLFRWSDIKGRWVYLETDRREEYNQQKAVLNEYLTSSVKTPAKNIRGGE